MSEEEFDLHAALTGRSYPKATVEIWLEEEPWYELEALEKKHSKLLADDPALKTTEDEIQRVQKIINETAYKVSLRGISPRAGEDIVSKALSQVPIRFDQYGRDNMENTVNRNRLIRELSFAAHLTKVVNPDGKQITVTDDNRQDIARMILGEAPPTAIETIDDTIKQVSRKFAEQQAKFSSPDFS